MPGPNNISDSSNIQLKPKLESFDSNKQIGVFVLGEKRYKITILGFDPNKVKELEKEDWAVVANQVTKMLDKKGIFKQFKTTTITESGVTPLKEKTISHYEDPNTWKHYEKIIDLLNKDRGRGIVSPDKKDLRNKIKSDKNQIAQKQKQVKDLEEKIQNADPSDPKTEADKAEKTKLEQEIITLKNDLNDHQKQLDKMSSQTKDSDAKARKVSKTLQPEKPVSDEALKESETRLKETKDSLQSEIHSLNQKVINLENSKGKGKKSLQKLKSQLKDLQRENDKLLNESQNLDQLKGEQASYHEKLDSLNNNLKLLQETNGKLDQELNDLKNTNKGLASEIDALKSVNQKQNQEIEALKKSLERGEPAVPSFPVDNTTFQPAERLSKEAKNLLKEKDLLINKLKKEFDDLKLQHDQLISNQNKLIKTNEAINSSTKKLKKTKSENDKLLQQLEKFQKAEKEKESLLADFEKQKTEAQKLLDENAQEKAELQNRLNALQTEYVQDKEKSSTEIQQLKDELTILKNKENELEKLKSKITNQKNKIQHLKNPNLANKDLEKAISSAKNEIKNLKESGIEKDRRIQALQEINDDFQRKLLESAQKQNEAKELKKTLENKNTAYLNSIAELEKGIQDLTELNRDEISRQADQILQERLAYQETVDNLNAQLEQLRDKMSDREDLQKSLDQAQSDLSNKAEELAKAKAEYQKAIQDAENSASEAREQFKSALQEQTIKTDELLKAKTEELRLVKTGSDQEKAQLQQEIGKLKAHNQALNELITAVEEQKQSEIDTLKNENLSNKQLLKAADEEIQKFHGESEDLKATLEQLKARIGEADKKESAAEQLKKTLENKNTAYLNSIAELENGIQDLTKLNRDEISRQADQILQERLAHQAIVDNLNAQLKQLRDKLSDREDLQKSLDQAQLDLSNKAEELAKAKADYQKAIQDAENSASEAREQFKSALQEQTIKTDELLTAKAGEIASLRSQTVQDQIKNQELQSELAKIKLNQDLIQNLLNKVEDQDTQLTSLQKENQANEIVIQASQQKIDQLKQKARGRKGQILNLEEKLRNTAQFEVRSRNLEEQLAAEKAQAQDTLNQLTKALEKEKISDQERKELTNRIEDLNAQLEKASDQDRQYQENIEKLNTQFNSVRQDLEKQLSVQTDKKAKEEIQRFLNQLTNYDPSINQSEIMEASSKAIAALNQQIEKNHLKSEETLFNVEEKFKDEIKNLKKLLQEAETGKQELTKSYESLLKAQQDAQRAETVKTHSQQTESAELFTQISQFNLDNSRALLNLIKQIDQLEEKEGSLKAALLNKERNLQIRLNQEKLEHYRAIGDYAKLVKDSANTFFEIYDQLEHISEEKKRLSSQVDILKNTIENLNQQLTAAKENSLKETEELKDLLSAIEKFGEAFGVQTSPSFAEETGSLSLPKIIKSRLEQIGSSTPFKSEEEPSVVPDLDFTNELYGNLSQIQNEKKRLEVQNESLQEELETYRQKIQDLERISAPPRPKTSIQPAPISEAESRKEFQELQRESLKIQKDLEEALNEIKQLKGKVKEHEGSEKVAKNHKDKAEKFAKELQKKLEDSETEAYFQQTERIALEEKLKHETGVLQGKINDKQREIEQEKQASDKKSKEIEAENTQLRSKVLSNEQEIADLKAQLEEIGQELKKTNQFFQETLEQDRKNIEEEREKRSKK